MSLQDVTQARFLKQMIARVRAASLDDTPQAKRHPKYMAMVVDSLTVKYLSCCCKVYDILEEGVTLVESISKKRQRLPNLEAIYYLHPNKDSIDRLCRDFENEKLPQYKSAHIFVSLPLSKLSEGSVTRGSGDHKTYFYQCMSQNPGLLSRLRSLVEFNLNYVAYERRVLHFNHLVSLQQYFPSCEPMVLDKVADELFTFCLSVGDRPNIRFHANEYRLNEQLALNLHQKLLKRKLPNLGHGRSTLLILDRSIDIAPLFLHEYTYQAAVYDLLNVPVCSPANDEKQNSGVGGADEPMRTDDSIEYEFAVARNKVEKRIALLNESDHVYVQYRHQHLMDASKSIAKEINNFFKENATAHFQDRPDMTNEEMQKAIRDLPKYQELLAKYSVHHYIAQQCFNEIARIGLQKIGMFEQDLATGVDASGKEVSVKKCLTAFGSILGNAEIGNEEKTRLLLLYFSMISGVKGDDRRKMVEAAQLPYETMRSIQTFIDMLLAKDIQSNQSGGAHHTHKVHADKERLNTFIQKARASDIPLSRFQPYIKTIMEKAAQGTLHAGRFPYVAEPAEKRNSANDSKQTNASAVRARNKDWDFGDFSKQDGSPQRSSVKTSAPDQKGLYSQDFDNNFGFEAEKNVVFIFVLGGVTFSEMRCAYEVSRSHDCNIYLAGSTILTPKRILASLKST